MPFADPRRSFTLRDGRALSFLIGGDPEGFPVFGLHGTPGCRFSRWYDDTPFAEAGVCFVTTDRAGYGRSSRHPGRTVADGASDIAQLADFLGFDRFAVQGGSGGGPHALACAALLPERVVRASCLVGIAPFGPPGLSRADWVAGMDSDNTDEVIWAEAGEERSARELRRLQDQMQERVNHDPATLFGDSPLCPEDRAYLTRPEVQQTIRRVIPEQAAEGIFGWVDDNLAFVRPWGFDVRDITVPTLVLYGRADALSPALHGEWLAANVPGCTVVVTDGGHLPFEPVVEIAEQMAWLKHGVTPSAAAGGYADGTNQV